MRMKLSVQFQGEEGIDAGGVSREWYQVTSSRTCSRCMPGHPASSGVSASSAEKSSLGDLFLNLSESKITSYKAYPAYAAATLAVGTYQCCKSCNVMCNPMLSIS